MNAEEFPERLWDFAAKGSPKPPGTGGDSISNAQ